jgi:hypothetical protein
MKNSVRQATNPLGQAEPLNFDFLADRVHFGALPPLSLSWPILRGAQSGITPSLAWGKAKSRTPQSRRSAVVYPKQ